MTVPGDCGRLVTCVYDYPRLMGCGYGSVFNENTLSCDDPENVPQWYFIILSLKKMSLLNYLVFFCSQNYYK